MAEHGTRACYQHGCRKLECRAAEAAYRANLRRRQVKGLPILGQLVSASEAWARIRRLKQEQLPNRRLTGRRDHHAVTFTASSRIRLVTLLRLRALCRYHLIADAELPTHTPGDDSRPLGSGC